MKRLENKVILITGCYTGIGKAIAQHCVREGARIVANGLQAELAPEIIKSLGKHNAVHITRDITEEDAPSELVEMALRSFDRLDAVVNNAALVASSDINTTGIDFFRQMLEINTLAPFSIIQAALPHLKATRGCVVNIGSINSWSGEPNLLPYSISKGALMTMSRNLGDSLFRDHGVRVNQVNPGWVLTEHEIIHQRERGMPEDWYTTLPEIFSPARRLFSPEEIAAGVVYLLSDECGPVSGQVLELEQFPMIGRNISKE